MMPLASPSSPSMVYVFPEPVRRAKTNTSKLLISNVDRALKGFSSIAY